MSIFKFEDYINEDAKDDKRVSDIVSKAGGDKEKEIALATKMANSIDTLSKAYELGAAAYRLKNWELANIFFDRAVALGNPVDALIKASRINGGTTSAQPVLAPTMPGTIDKKAIDDDLDAMIDTTDRIHYGKNGWDSMTNGTKYRKAAAHLTDTYKTAPEIEYIIDELMQKFKLTGNYISKASPYSFPSRSESGDPRRATIQNLVNSYIGRLGKIDPSLIEKYSHLKFDAVEKQKVESFTQSFKDECILLAQSYTFENDLVDQIKKNNPEPIIDDNTRRGRNGGPKVLYVTQPLAFFAWEEIAGQLSDGYWENSRPYDHWKWVTGIKVVLSDKNALIGTGPWRSYNFSAVNEYMFDGKEEREFLLKAVQLGSYKMVMLLVNNYNLNSMLKKFNDLSKVSSYDVSSLIDKCKSNNIDVQMLKAFIGKTIHMKADQSLVSKAISDIKKSVYGDH